tara:strand:- start:241 stop:399 length:159 start_codon:yes stop_codon:yes gene_type:complete
MFKRYLEEIVLKDLGKDEIFILLNKIDVLIIHTIHIEIKYAIIRISILLFPK